MNKKFCIKLVIIKKLYYDARPTKYQNFHTKQQKNLCICMSVQIGDEKNECDMNGSRHFWNFMCF